MAKQIRLGVLFGGRSSEHEVSLRSAKSVVSALDTKRYKIVLYGIDKNGTWLSRKDSKILFDTGRAPKVPKDLVPKIDPKDVDVVFPVLHGSFGEDGTMQGFLKLIDVPFVGPGVLGSSACMDKDVTKRLLKEAGIGVADGFVFRKGDDISFSLCKKKLGFPMFVKPANAGSSVGVSKVTNEAQFGKAVKEAFLFDEKILIEKGIEGREIECAVLGNEDPKASVPGEILPDEEFYSYSAKYADSSKTATIAKADLPKALSDKIRKEAVKAYKALELEGLSRVDFFVKKDGNLIVNEINTIPGFTSISMYPKMWEETGLSYPKLLDELIAFALKRYKRDSKKKTSV